MLHGTETQRCTSHLYTKPQCHQRGQYTRHHFPQSARLVTKTHKHCKCARIRLPPPDILLLQSRRSKKRVSRVLTKKCTETTTAIPSEGKDQPILLRRGWTYLTFRKRGTCRGMISSSPLDRECVSEHIVVVLLSYLHGTSLSNGFSSRLVRVLEM